jgi:UDP-N-acetyl-D-mannosaminuronic acid dehydrogenase
MGRRPWIAIMGLAYKPNIEDLRESPALYIANRLAAEGLQLLVSEPNLDHHEEFTLVSPADATAQADVVVYLVAHREFFDLAVEPNKVLDFCGVTRR